MKVAIRSKNAFMDVYLSMPEFSLKAALWGIFIWRHVGKPFFCMG
jgi:hypothetical protein